MNQLPLTTLCSLFRWQILLLLILMKNPCQAFCSLQTSVSCSEFGYLLLLCHFPTIAKVIPYQEHTLPTSVRSILHNIFVRWYTCIKIHACFNTSDYSMLVIGFCWVRPLRDCSSYFHKVYTLLLHPVSDALAANSKR